MGKLTDLLRWKRKVILVDSSGGTLKDDKGNALVVWMRVLGDEDQQQAYRLARIRSAKKRELLRNPESVDYQDEILPIKEADIGICKELVKVSKRTQFTTDALANVERPELPQMEEVAIDGDAPSLEDQEKLDKLVDDVEKEYQKALQEYIDTRMKTLEAELDAMDEETLRGEAMFETSNALALNAFMVEVADEKAWRSVYLDERCNQRAFENIEDFRELPSVTKAQVLSEYERLEMSPDDIKN
jgi:hypothetical protein